MSIWEHSDCYQIVQVGTAIPFAIASPARQVSLCIWKMTPTPQPSQSGSLAQVELHR